MAFPRDFVEEIEAELSASRRALLLDAARIEALTELHSIARAVAMHLGRPITVFDVIRSTDPGEREQRSALVRQLRTR